MTTRTEPDRPASPPSGPPLEELTLEQVEAEIALYEPLTAAVRGLVDACVRTEVAPEVVRDVTRVLEEQLARLRAEQLPGAYGTRWTTLRKRRAWGNAVIGRRNPLAPPLELEVDADGTVRADFHLGAAYEGPHQLTHGGVAALVLDQVLGAAAEVSGAPGMTGTLTLRYLRATPLGDLRVEARATRHEGVKTFAEGVITGPDGPCVEAEGVFILPAHLRASYDAHRDAIGYDPSTHPVL